MIDLQSLHVRTITGQKAVNPVFGSAPDDSPLSQALPESARLLDYDIVEPIGEGGFGIVYLAWDRVAQGHVAIKEYLPATLAQRAKTSTAVALRSVECTAMFQAGLRNFTQGAERLAGFDHPGLVKVLRCWQANGTAYMAMHYHPEPTLAWTLSTLGRAPDEAELRAMLHGLLDALTTLHAGACLHGDIAPDNILLTEDGPLLLDFGAVRRVGDSSAGPDDVFLKPGYAPLEQYGVFSAAPTSALGPWTDLHALASVIRTAITGQPPPPASARRDGAPCVPLTELARGSYSETFLAAIDAALALDAVDRPQSADEFRARLDARPGPRRAASPAPTALTTTESAQPPSEVAPDPQPQPQPLPAVAAGAALAQDPGGRPHSADEFRARRDGRPEPQAVAASPAPTALATSKSEPPPLQDAVESVLPASLETSVALIRPTDDLWHEAEQSPVEALPRKSAAARYVHVLGMAMVGAVLGLIVLIFIWYAAQSGGSA